MLRHFAVFLVAAIAVYAGPIGRQEEVSYDVHVLTVNGSQVCQVSGQFYSRGEDLPTSDPCEYCTCQPPGFACTVVKCEYKPGCRALERSGLCCPEYICDCEKDGVIYKNGDRISDNSNPCEDCYCVAGEVTCSVIQCSPPPPGCIAMDVEGKCCPSFNCSVEADERENNIVEELSKESVSVIENDASVDTADAASNLEISLTTEANIELEAGDYFIDQKENDLKLEESITVDERTQLESFTEKINLKEDAEDESSQIVTISSVPFFDDHTETDKSMMENNEQQDEEESYKDPAQTTNSSNDILFDDLSVVEESTTATSERFDENESDVTETTEADILKDQLFDDPIDEANFVEEANIVEDLVTEIAETSAPLAELIFDDHTEKTESATESIIVENNVDENLLKELVEADVPFINESFDDQTEGIAFESVTRESLVDEEKDTVLKETDQTTSTPVTDQYFNDDTERSEFSNINNERFADEIQQTVLALNSHDHTERYELVTETSKGPAEEVNLNEDLLSETNDNLFNDHTMRTEASTEIIGRHGEEINIEEDHVKDIDHTVGILGVQLFDDPTERTELVTEINEWVDEKSNINESPSTEAEWIDERINNDESFTTEAAQRNVSFSDQSFDDRKEIAETAHAMNKKYTDDMVGKKDSLKQSFPTASLTNSDMSVDELTTLSPMDLEDSENKYWMSMLLNGNLGDPISIANQNRKASSSAKVSSINYFEDIETDTKFHSKDEVKKIYKIRVKPVNSFFNSEDNSLFREKEDVVTEQSPSLIETVAAEREIVRDVQTEVPDVNNNKSNPFIEIKVDSSPISKTSDTVEDSVNKSILNILSNEKDITDEVENVTELAVEGEKDGSTNTNDEPIETFEPTIEPLSFVKSENDDGNVITERYSDADIVTVEADSQTFIPEVRETATESQMDISEEGETATESNLDIPVEAETAIESQMDISEESEITTENALKELDVATEQEKLNILQKMNDEQNLKGKISKENQNLNEVEFVMEKNEETTGIPMNINKANVSKGGKSDFTLIVEPGVETTLSVRDEETAVTESSFDDSLMDNVETITEITDDQLTVPSVILIKENSLPVVKTSDLKSEADKIEVTTVVSDEFAISDDIEETSTENGKITISDEIENQPKENVVSLIEEDASLVNIKSTTDDNDGDFGKEEISLDGTVDDEVSTFSPSLDDIAVTSKTEETFDIVETGDSAVNPTESPAEGNDQLLEVSSLPKVSDTVKQAENFMQKIMETLNQQNVKIDGPITEQKSEENNTKESTKLDLNEIQIKEKMENVSIIEPAKENENKGLKGESENEELVTEKVTTNKQNILIPLNETDSDKPVRINHQFVHLARKYGLRPLTKRTFRDDIKMRKKNRKRTRTLALKWQNQ